MIRNILKLALFLFIISVFRPLASAQTSTLSGDSTTVRKKSGSFSLANMFNTGSMYYFTGVVSNNKPSFDMRLVYDNARRNWGVLLFKSFELLEHNGPINYALIVLNKRYFIGSRILISPQAGAQINRMSIFFNCRLNVVCRWRTMAIMNVESFFLFVLVRFLMLRRTYNLLKLFPSKSLLR